MILEKDLFKLAIKDWPEQLDISDGNIFKGERSFFKKLSSIYAQIENNIDYVTEHWRSLGSWALYCTISEEAKNKLLTGHNTFSKDEVPISLFRDNLIHNLNMEGWEEQKNIFLKDKPLCEKIFEEEKSYWPDILDISDGEVEKYTRFESQQIIEIYSEIEDSVLNNEEDEKVDYWRKLYTASFHSALLALAREKFLKNEFTIYPADTSLKIFDKNMRFHLEAECWEEERKEYVSSFAPNPT